MNENFERADEWTFTQESGGWGRGGAGVRGETPRQPARKSVPHIRGKNAQPQPEIEPSPSNMDDKFTLSERAGSGPLNYWLPRRIEHLR